MIITPSDMDEFRIYLPGNADTITVGCRLCPAKYAPVEASKGYPAIRLWDAVDWAKRHLEDCRGERA